MTCLRLPIALTIAAQLAILGAAHAQERPAFRPTFKWNEKVHNFGKLRQGVPVSTTFVLTNVGEEPLILTDVSPTCGCILADYTKTPIRKGDRGRITVTYNAISPGPFKKSVIVHSNATTPMETLLVTGRVDE